MMQHPPQLLENSIYRTVTGYFPYADGRGRIPAVEFNPTIRLSSSAGLVTTQEPYRVSLDANGNFAISLLTTDSNPDIYPEGWCWEVKEDFKGGSRYWFLLPYGDGSSISLSEIAPIPQKPPLIGWTTGPKGKQGDQGYPGADGQDGAFRVFRQPIRPDPIVDELNPGDLWFEMDPPPDPVPGQPDEGENYV
jgi:hypothetical protein